MLINLSNHPSSKWSKEQTDAANSQFGEIVDMPFPQVNPENGEIEIAALAEQYVGKIRALADGQTVIVHIMGEMTLTFAIIGRLKSLDIPCVASTTQRLVKEMGDGHKDVVFQFVRFRNYL